jgi:hypothetical protein
LAQTIGSIRGATRILSIARSGLRRTEAIDAEGASDAGDGFVLCLRLEELRNLRTALTASHTHVARERRTAVAAIDHEIMALWLAANRLVDRGMD